MTITDISILANTEITNNQQYSIQINAEHSFVIIKASRVEIIRNSFYEPEVKLYDFTGHNIATMLAIDIEDMAIIERRD